MNSLHSSCFIDKNYIKYGNCFHAFGKVNYTITNIINTINAQS